MTDWRATAALQRALLLAGLGLVVAIASRQPMLVVLVAPLALLGVHGLLHRPRHEPTVRTEVGHQLLHEGQGTTSTLLLEHAEDVEQVTRAASLPAYVALRPTRGALCGLVSEPETVRMVLSPRRWGRVNLGEEQVALTTPWGGFRWGPVATIGRPLSVLPSYAAYDSRAEAPQPEGLVGGYRSRRPGTGTEFSGIRPFAPGDRLRRISWRVSLRRQELHVVEARAETDTGVLLVVDALTDAGRSGGVDGRASSLDLTVRAAAALAEHHTRRGDRVALRVVGGTGRALGYSTGTRHLRRLLGALAEIRPGPLPRLPRHGLDLGAAPGTEVVILSPLLQPAMVNTAASLARRGLPVMVIDTLPVGPLAVEAFAPVDPSDRSADALRHEAMRVAWRMRRLERDMLAEQLAHAGCPVVRWQGPGTLDEVLRRLARRAALPRAVRR